MTLRITSPDAAVAVTPYLLGFTPTDSLVLMFSDPELPQRSLRVDLPDQVDLRWLQGILAGVSDPPLSSLVVIVYADTVPLPFAQAVADWVTSVFDPAVEVLDSVIVHDAAMHSLLHAIQGGESVPMSEIENHPLVAECVALGMTRLASRDALHALLEFVDDDFSHKVTALLDGGQPIATSYEQQRDMLERRAFEALMARVDLTAFDVMVIGLACSDVFARDPLITLLLDEHAGDREVLHPVRDRLAFAISHLPDDLAGPTAATLALLSWSQGDGASALVAADRAMAADPTNTLGPLVSDALQHGLPPETWANVTGDIPMDVLRGQYRHTA
jgi:Domain of unknown function (DUF4192)